METISVADGRKVAYEAVGTRWRDRTLVQRVVERAVAPIRPVS